MACPNCDHTMQSVGLVRVIAVYWCPRCGTIKTGDDVSTPMLVERVSKLHDLLDIEGSEDEIERFNRLGITESIPVKD